MILKWNYALIMKIFKVFIYAQIFIAHYSSILRNIGVHFLLKCPKWYVLRYSFMKLDKNVKIKLSIFNGCRTNLEFFTVCIKQSFFNQFSKILCPNLFTESD